MAITYTTGETFPAGASVVTATKLNNIVNAMTVTMATAKVLGRTTASTGAVEELGTLPTAVQDNITRLGTIAVPLVGSDSTDSSSSTTGAFKTAGGMGIAKKLFVGTNASVGGTTTLTGATSIGSTPQAGIGIYIATSGAFGGASTSYAGVQEISELDATKTVLGVGFDSRMYTAAASFTLTELRHFSAQPQTFGAGSAVTSQSGFYAGSALTGATNNYGFHGNIAAGTNRYNLYMEGTAMNYLNGNTAIGQLPSSTSRLILGGNVTGATTMNGVFQQGTIKSDVTGAFNAYRSRMVTDAASFTLSSYNHFLVGGAVPTVGAGSTVTDQVAFYAGANVTGATNNYGFRGSIASAANSYNLYMDGTAHNYLAGVTGIGIAASATAALAVAASTTDVASLRVPHGTAPSSPVNGDIWTTSSGIFVRINGVTKTITIT